jgi:hypothetical protein
MIKDFYKEMKKTKNKVPKIESCRFGQTSTRKSVWLKQTI